MIESIGGISIVAGMFLIAVWFENKNLKAPLVFGLLGIAMGLFIVLACPSPKVEAPSYSSEWIDEETKCHFWDGNPVSCESVRYTEEL